MFACNFLENFFQKIFLPLLPSIRAGGAEESALGDIFEEKERSPFAQTRMDAWIKGKKRNEEIARV